jgi:hypothetical protein
MGQNLNTSDLNYCCRHITVFMPSMSFVAGEASRNYKVIVIIIIIIIII